MIYLLIKILLKTNKRMIEINPNKIPQTIKKKIQMLNKKGNLKGSIKWISKN